MRSLPRVTAAVALLLLLSSLPAAAQRRYGTARPMDGFAAIHAAEQAEQTIESLRADPDYERLFQAGDVKKKLQQAQAKLALARDSYGQGRAAEAREFAIAAQRAFDALERELRARWERSRAQEVFPGQPDAQDQALRDSLTGELADLARDARDLLVRPANVDDVTLERRGALGKALKDYERLGPNASTAELRRVRDALWQAGAEVRQALRAHTAPPGAIPVEPGATTFGGQRRQRDVPPEVLRLAVASFFSGDYRRTEELLRDGDLSDEHAAKVAHLLRGAALFSLYVESGERDKAMLDRAMAEVRECQRLDPTLEPDRAAFSPRYADLFRR